MMQMPPFRKMDSKIILKKLKPKKGISFSKSQSLAGVVNWPPNPMCKALLSVPSKKTKQAGHGGSILQS
jgi:hypothetical protein